jgi:hypothetical protein
MTIEFRLDRVSPCYGFCQESALFYFINVFLSLGDWFFSKRFLFKAGAELPLADLLSAHVDTVPDDLFESEEERAHPIYQTGSDQLTQGRAGRAPFQKLFSCKGVFY